MIKFITTSCYRGTQAHGAGTDATGLSDCVITKNEAYVLFMYTVTKHLIRSWLREVLS